MPMISWNVSWNLICNTSCTSVVGLNGDSNIKLIADIWEYKKWLNQISMHTWNTFVVECWWKELLMIEKRKLKLIMDDDA